MTSKQRDDHETIDPFRGPLPGEDVAVMRTASGRALMLPRSVSKLRGEQLELVVELQDQAAAVHEAQEALDRLVDDCREQGISWTGIGFSVGLSSQGARQRWFDGSGAG